MNKTGTQPHRVTPITVTPVPVQEAKTSIEIARAACTHVQDTWPFPATIHQRFDRARFRRDEHLARQIAINATAVNSVCLPKSRDLD